MIVSLIVCLFSMFFLIFNFVQVKRWVKTIAVLNKCTTNMYHLGPRGTYIIIIVMFAQHSRIDAKQIIANIFLSDSLAVVSIFNPPPLSAQYCWSSIWLRRGPCSVWARRVVFSIWINVGSITSPPSSHDIIYAYIIKYIVLYLI